MRHRVPRIPALLSILLACLATLAAPAPIAASPADELARAAMARLEHDVVYDGRYRAIPYPGGDVPDTIGVCTDLVIRAYRSVGIDLQVLVHEDMTRAFDRYPRIWGHDGPDPNIDHRRVPNLRVFFERNGAALPVTRDPGDYRPGDLVTWTLPSGLPHVGIVVGPAEPGSRPRIIHNIGQGPALDDVLFAWPVTGHYRFPVDRPSDR